MYLCSFVVVCLRCDVWRYIVIVTIRSVVLGGAHNCWRQITSNLLFLFYPSILRWCSQYHCKITCNTRRWRSKTYRQTNTTFIANGLTVLLIDFNQTISNYPSTDYSSLFSTYFKNVNSKSLATFVQNNINSKDRRSSISMNHIFHTL